MTAREELLDVDLYLALHAGDNGHFWTTDPARMMEILRGTSRCARKVTPAHWPSECDEFCGKAAPCRDHPGT